MSISGQEMQMCIRDSHTIMNKLSHAKQFLFHFDIPLFLYSYRDKYIVPVSYTHLTQMPE